MSTHAYMIGLGHGAVFKEVWNLFSPVTLHFPPGRNIFVFSGLVAFKNVSLCSRWNFGRPQSLSWKELQSRLTFCLNTLYWSTSFSSVSGWTGGVMFSPLLRVLDFFCGIALSFVIHFYFRKWSEYSVAPLLSSALLRYIDISFYSFFFDQSSVYILFSHLLSLLWRDSYSKIIMIWLQEDGWVDWF